MKLEDAAKQLEALGNPTRLAVYRVLIRHGQQGSPVGKIRKKLDIPDSSRRSGIAVACIAKQISRTWMP